MMTTTTGIERGGRDLNGHADGEIFYSVRISGISGRSAGEPHRDPRKTVRFNVYRVRDGLVAEELAPEQALDALIRLGLMARA